MFIELICRSNKFIVTLLVKKWINWSEYFINLQMLQVPPDKWTSANIPGNCITKSVERWVAFNAIPRVKIRYPQKKGSAFLVSGYINDRKVNAAFYFTCFESAKINAVFSKTSGKDFISEAFTSWKHIIENACKGQKKGK